MGSGKRSMGSRSASHGVMVLIREVIPRFPEVMQPIHGVSRLCHGVMEAIHGVRKSIPDPKTLKIAPLCHTFTPHLNSFPQKPLKSSPPENLASHPESAHQREQ